MRSTAQKYTLKQQALPDFRVVLEAAPPFVGCCRNAWYFTRIVARRIRHAPKSLAFDCTTNAVTAHARAAASG